MNRINVKINKYTKSVSNIDTMNLNTNILKYIFYSFGVLAFGYVFILGNMITNILERRAFEIEIRELTNSISALELDYLEKGSNIDLAYSHSLGFSDTKVFYVTRQNIEHIKLAKNAR